LEKKRKEGNKRHGRIGGEVGITLRKRKIRVTTGRAREIHCENEWKNK